MKNLIEYKAGLMVLRAGMFEPDSRKGLLYVCLMETEIHICWKDRRTDRVELDILAVPGVPRFQRVSQVNTGRVYVLRFEGARERHFFWMQEAFPERDDDFCRRFNELIVASKEPEPPKIELLDPDYPRGGGGSDVPAPPPPGKLGALARGLLGFLGKRCQLVGSLEALSLGPAALRAALDGDFEGFLSILNEPGAFIEEQEDAN
ncbi:GL14276 [Drosophila persimilis]|uniref:GL14276 n=1 Tax=Drosophila persimilis TaxID=7234 RepID=B4GTG6_DROPE|nr:GL14276 [Drosophila persimilis]